MLCIEIFLSIHFLLLVSSWFMRGSWLFKAPSLKLKLARLLLVSCVLSPLAVHCIQTTDKPLLFKFVALDGIQDYAKQPIIKAQQTPAKLQSLPIEKLNTINYWQLFLILFCMVIGVRGCKLFADLKKLKSILHTAVPYRTCGRLVIKVSDYCHIPFALRLFNKAYIILPVSILSSTQNVKIAIAHEGQHHRNGDCLWVYFIECIRIVFWGNPGAARWHRILNELQEFSCDEALVGHQKISAHDYGHCLFKVVQTVSQYSKSCNRELACTVGMALGSKQQENTMIIRRISMLQNYQSKHSRHAFLGIMLAGVAITAPICSAYAAMGSLTGSKNKALDTSFLDPKIQAIAVDEIAAAMKKYHAKSAVIAVADPSTGKIIAFAEAGDVNGAKSWTSRVFAPASTIKPFVAAVAIDSGVASESKVYDCHSPYYVDGMKFNNYDAKVGSVSMADAMTKSVNVCFIKAAQDTGAVKFRKKLDDFGFDMSSWWQKDKSDDLQLAQASMGESIPVTLETLTNSYTVLANKGHLSSSNSQSIISEPTAKSVTHMLEKVIEEGTGRQAAIPGVAVAGKTGTLVDTEHGTHLALFSGFVPADAPQYVMVVVIEEGSITKQGKKSMHGGALAAPVFHNVAVKSLSVLNKK